MRVWASETATGRCSGVSSRRMGAAALLPRWMFCASHSSSCASVMTDSPVMWSSLGTRQYGRSAADGPSPAGCGVRAVSSSGCSAVQRGAAGLGVVGHVVVLQAGLAGVDHVRVDQVGQLGVAADVRGLLGEAL